MQCSHAQPPTRHGAAVRHARLGRRACVWFPGVPVKHQAPAGKTQVANLRFARRGPVLHWDAQGPVRR